MDGFLRVVADGGEPEAAPAQRGRRDSFLLSASVRLAGSSSVHEGRVRNLSPGGMMIEFEDYVQPGTAVTLEMRGLGELSGHVAWCTDGRIGVALDRPIDPRKARKPVGGGATTPDYAKPATGRTPRR